MLTIRTLLARPPLKVPKLLVPILTASIAGMSIGMNASTLSTLLSPMTEEWDLVPEQQGALQAALLFGAMIGCTFGGWVGDRIGRRKLAIFASLLIILFTIHSALAWSFVHLVIARVMQGLPHAMIFCTVPSYVSEMSPASLRGRIGVLYSLFINLGVFVIFGFGFAFEQFEMPYRYSLLSSIGCSLPLFLWTVLCMPESPRWLRQRRLEAAYSKQAQLPQQEEDHDANGLPSSDHLQMTMAESELDEKPQTKFKQSAYYLSLTGDDQDDAAQFVSLQDEGEISQAEDSNIKKPQFPPPMLTQQSEPSLSTIALFPVENGENNRVIHAEDDVYETAADDSDIIDAEGRSITFTSLFLDNPRAWSLAVVLCAANQLSGVSAVFFYGPFVLRRSGFEPIAATMAFGAWSAVCTLSCTFLADRVGRRPLFLIGMVGMGLSDLAISLSYFFLDTQEQSLVVMIFLFVFIFFMNLGPAPLTLVLITEVFPQKARAKAVSIVLVLLYVFIVSVSFGFPAVIAAVGSAFTFLGFTTFALVSTIALYFLLVETSGKELEAIKT